MCLTKLDKAAQRDTCFKRLHWIRVLHRTQLRPRITFTAVMVIFRREVRWVGQDFLRQSPRQFARLTRVAVRV